MERNMMRKFVVALVLCVVASLTLAVVAQCQGPIDPPQDTVYVSQDFVARMDAFGQVTVSQRR